ncbi:MAG: aconitate hydratase AcnA [Magnetococcales bacterium]|nr:aconitate hydratase AcnA [Magnetococcales bacterium]
MKNSYHTEASLRVGNELFRIQRLAQLSAWFDWQRLPICHRILLENLLRHEDGDVVCREDIAALAAGGSAGKKDIAFYPARVLLQDFTGVPCLVDLAGMREAMVRLGGDPERVNPLRPVDLVIDHSVQVDVFGTDQAYDINAEMEMARNRERYTFLRWGQESFANLRVAPPDKGIVHQINLEYLAQVVFAERVAGVMEAFPDTLVGADSHTPMVNGVGVLGWGVGGIEAEIAMLGEPLYIQIPPVTGVRLSGRLREGVTATDLVLTLTQKLRQRGVVGHIVEFLGSGLDHLSLASRATIANMSPEFGATCSYFPIDEETLRYLRRTNRPEARIQLVEAYAREQGMFRESGQESNFRFDDFLEFDLSRVEPCLAGPGRPQDRLSLSALPDTVGKALTSHSSKGTSRQVEVVIPPHNRVALRDGSLVIAAITSCTNTSNPEVLVAAGLLARKARALGLRVPPFVKTSFAPGSQVVMDYLQKAGLLDDLNALGFHLVAFGCTTCIGNSGPLHPAVSQAIRDNHLQVCAVLSGNRNFEGRIHPQVAQSYLASPPLVVAYALAGRMDLDLEREPLGVGMDGQGVTLGDIWPTDQEIQAIIEHYVSREMYEEGYQNLFTGTRLWDTLQVPVGVLYAWDAASTYIQPPPFLKGMTRHPVASQPIRQAQVLAFLGDSVTTDHISPAGDMDQASPAGQYLLQQGVAVADFNAYGTRRGNHEVMVRGTFANIRLQNRLTPGQQGGWTMHLPSAQLVSIFEAATRYRQQDTPLVVLAGREYGSGSSRDWAAKGPLLLGVKAVLAVSYERIHRTNLVGMGILPLQFQAGESADTLGLTGWESYDIESVADTTPATLAVTAHYGNGKETRFTVQVRIDTPREWSWYHHGGILPFMLRRLLDKRDI